MTSRRSGVKPELNWKGALVIVRPPSPAIVLANCLSEKATLRLWIVSGERSIGKTTWCAEVVEQARLAGMTVGGIICPAEFENNNKISFDLVDIATGESRPLGRRGNDANPGLRVGSWQLDRDVIAWGNQILQSSGDKDLLIIDELGDLEFRYGDGFQEAFRILDDGSHQTAMVVIRPDLLETAFERWPDAQIIQIGEVAE